MNRRLARGVGAGVLALVCGAAGSTLSAPTGAADVRPNIVRGGILRLTLGPGEPTGATLGFDHLVPGQERNVRVWLAGNDLVSTVPAVLAMTVDGVRDVPAPCATSLGKAQGEIDSGTAGCSIVDGVAAGTPRQGNLSRVVEFDIRYGAALGGACPAAAGRSLLDSAVVGNLSALRGRTITVADPRGQGPLRFAPGGEVCVSVTARWPRTGAGQGSPDHPVDNAVQGDALTLGVHFDLTQVRG